VTQFPVPVLTGIGHEKDLSVTDLVAHKSLKTPTAVADFIIECMAEAENQLNEMSSEIAKGSLAIIEEYKDLTESFKIKLLPVTKLMISNQKEYLSNRIIEMINYGKEYILKAGLIPAGEKSKLSSAARAFLVGKQTQVDKDRTSLMRYSVTVMANLKTRMDGLLNNLNILNPENVLRRGFTLTTVKGILKSVSHVHKDDVIAPGSRW